MSEEKQVSTDDRTELGHGPWQVVQKDLWALVGTCSRLEKEKIKDREDFQVTRRKMYLEFLEVVDTFENLFKEFEGSPDKAHEAAAQWVGNFRIVYKMAVRALKRGGVVEMPVAPDELVASARHNVVEVEHYPDKPVETITAVLKKGYLLGDEILRVAEVRAVKRP